MFMRELQPARIKDYGGFLTITLSKTTKPGDGKFGRGTRKRGS